MLSIKGFNLLIFWAVAYRPTYGQVYPYQDPAAPAYQYPEENQRPNLGFPQDPNLGFPQDPGVAYPQDPEVPYDPNSMVYQDPNVPYQDPNRVFPDPNLAFPDPNMIYPDPNMIYPDPNMVYPDPNMVNPPVDQPVGPPNDLFQPEPYPYQDLGMAQQQPPPSGWYIPPGAVPNGFELDDTPNINEGSLNDPGEYIDNDFEENSPLEWQNPVDYYPAGYAPQEMQYDYNNYYAGPCMEPPIIWDNGCGNAGEVPYCDQATCTQNCLQFMNSAKGVCIDYECFCEKTEAVTEKPKPEQDWSHDNQNEWPEKYPQCGQPQQSPQCHLEGKSEVDLSRKITFDYYKEPFGLIVENTGHGVRIYVQAEEKLPALDLKGVRHEGKDMSGRFTLSHIDLHWSRSEHCVKGLRGDLEMQLNHFDLSFEDYDQASQNPGATIALSLILEVHGNETDLCKAVSNALKTMVEPHGAGETIGSMAHLKFIPENIGMEFYLYPGSQTEPPCRPQNWLISQTQFKVLESQIEELKQLHDILGHPILHNVRDDQTS